jgi:hypothetical protein
MLVALAHSAIRGSPSWLPHMLSFVFQDACETLCKRLEPFKAANPKGKWADWVKAAYCERVSLSATGFYRCGILFDDCPTLKHISSLIIPPNSNFCRAYLVLLYSSRQICHECYFPKASAIIFPFLI